VLVPASARPLVPPLPLPVVGPLYGTPQALIAGGQR
jgi:hypothetical protein